jgi:hypothetical protein
LGPIPNPQSPIPNFFSFYFFRSIINLSKNIFRFEFTRINIPI